jgi:diacylglycerol diphosphate phosphatase/phosphatidate phosphatase
MQQHHVLDIVFGMIIGLSLGIAAYRSSYAAIFDFRYNHIPLPPFAARIRFSYNREPINEQEQIEGPQPEVDQLVVWSWWTQSGPREAEREREVLWFRNIRNASATGSELRSLFPSFTLSRKLRHRDGGPRDLDGVWDLAV